RGTGKQFVTRKEKPYDKLKKLRASSQGAFDQSFSGESFSRIHGPDRSVVAALAPHRKGRVEAGSARAQAGGPLVRDRSRRLRVQLGQGPRVESPGKAPARMADQRGLAIRSGARYRGRGAFQKRGREADPLHYRAQGYREVRDQSAGSLECLR